MVYAEAIQFLYQLRVFGVKLGLENTLRLAEWAGRPQDKLRFVHAAGTNGKGSTCAMLESIYRAAGLRVGLFTSPHLVSFTERIQVNRQRIAPLDVARLVNHLQNAPLFSDGGDGHPTFFEAVTIMALIYFAEQRCDLVIWETGMGGRLDATNIVIPLASVITNVQLDHQQWLGSTVTEIAREKAGIVKEGVPVITGSDDESVLQVIRETAQKRHAPLGVVSQADAEAMTQYELPLPGAHQRLNAAVALKTVQILDSAIPVSEDAIRRGLRTTKWAGRGQIITRPNGQTVLLDGAHNPAGAETLAATVRHDFAGKEFTFILGLLSDKDCPAVCQTIAPLASRIFLVPVGSERTARPESLADACKKGNPSASINICASLDDALAQSDNEPFVVITGSLYLIGEALERLGVAAPSQERTLNEYGGAPIRAVTFDAAGTLIEPWPSVGDVYSAVAKRHGLDIPPDILNQRFIEAWTAKKNFGYAKSEWAALVEQTFAGLAPAPPSASFFAELYDEFAKASVWRVYDDVRPCLERLRARGIRLAVISNWDERLRPLLRTLALDRYFDTVLISAEVGAHKPDGKIFQRAAEQLQTPASAILHVGDGRSEDYDGARAAGYQARLIKRGQPATESGTIASLDELARISAVQPAPKAGL